MEKLMQPYIPDPKGIGVLRQFYKEPSVILRIKARKGQKGAYLDGKLSQNPHEQEVLLPHDAKFIITGHSTLEVKRGNFKDHIKVYECEMI